MRPRGDLGPVLYVNGERESVRLPLDEPAGRPAARPVPSRLAFVDRTSGRAHEVTFDDDDETPDAFARAGAGGRPIDLAFAPDDAGALRIVVRGGNDTITLRRARVATFGAR